MIIEQSGTALRLAQPIEIGYRARLARLLGLSEHCYFFTAVFSDYDGENRVEVSLVSLPERRWRGWIVNYLGPRLVSVSLRDCDQDSPMEAVELALFFRGLRVRSWGPVSWWNERGWGKLISPCRE